MKDRKTSFLYKARRYSLNYLGILREYPKVCVNLQTDVR